MSFEKGDIFFLLSQHCSLILSCANIFIDWNWFSCERYGPWVSWVFFGVVVVQFHSCDLAFFTNYFIPFLHNCKYQLFPVLTITNCAISDGYGHSLLNLSMCPRNISDRLCQCSFFWHEHNWPSKTTADTEPGSTNHQATR